jgi:hypothetical protein
MPKRLVISGHSYRVLRHPEFQEHGPWMEPENALVQPDRWDATGAHLVFQIARSES